MERDNYICQDCGKKCKKYQKGLDVHHIKPYASFPALRLDIGNGITLCRRCHRLRHGRQLPEPTMIPCACGCGTLIPDRDPYGRRRRYVNFHGKNGRRKLPPAALITCACGCGTVIRNRDPQGRAHKWSKGHHLLGISKSAASNEAQRKRMLGRTLTPAQREKHRQALKNSKKRLGRPPKLTSQDILAIRASLLRQDDLALAYGISQTMISHIRTHKAYAHITYTG